MIALHSRVLGLILCLLLVAGCDSGNKNSVAEVSHEPTVTPAASVSLAGWEADEQPSTVYYEIFVRSFYDSNGDGIGDLNGITQKLAYLKELGVGGIWLMPITDSPSYHGYDVTDYYTVNSDYGTVEDLKVMVAKAHEMGIKVIMCG